jgi:hypothetical protein
MKTVPLRGIFTIGFSARNNESIFAEKNLRRENE